MALPGESQVVRLLALAALSALRALTALVFAAGIGAFVAALVVIPFASQSDYQWVAAVPRSARLVGLIFLAGSIASFLIMPRWAAVIRQIPPSANQLPIPVGVIAMGWCITIVWSLPALARWFRKNAEAAIALLGPGSDDLRLTLVPAAVADALPALTLLALLIFAITALLVLASRPELAFRVIAACASIQAALVLGEYIARGTTFAVASGIIAALQPEGVETARISAWLAENDTIARAFEWRLIAMFGTALAALAFSRGTASAMQRTEAVAAPRTAIIAEPPASIESPAATAPPVPRAQRAAVDSPFSESNYSARARMSWNPFVRRYADYAVASIPPMSRHKFAFSWNTGRFTRASNGEVVFSVTPARAPGLFFDNTYEVRDAFGVPIGTLVPNGPDWTIQQASGEGDVYVLRGRSGLAYSRFVASRGERELCRFTWTIQRSVVSAEIEVEFTPDADSALRTLAMALAPIVELRSRLHSERTDA